MNLPTQDHLQTLRDLLADRAVELRADIHAGDQRRQVAVADAGPDVVDRKDEAMQSELSMRSGQQDEHARAELRRVEAAHGRLDAGSYGGCADCAAAIPFQRLLVQPAATRCAACQAKREAVALRAS